MIEEQLEAILTDTQGGQNALIPLLQKVQEALGYIPEEAVFAIGERAGVPASEVFGILTFYTQFRLVPQGRKIIRVCRGTACHVRGASALLRDLEEHLGIQAGETTPDMEYTLETVACIGACALAPTMTINDQVYGQMDAKKVEKMLGGKKGGLDG
jgi:NADH:ubiquinone oxidoreductase subunit E